MRTALLTIASLLSVFVVWGQTDVASLSGRVTDQSGGAILGAEVTVTNTGTGTSNQMKTNDAGIYNFSSLVPGPYRLSVRAKGFQNVEQRGIVLHVEDRATEDISMPIGSSVQTVIVQGEATEINTQSATV